MKNKTDKYFGPSKKGLLCARFCALAIAGFFAASASAAAQTLSPAKPTTQKIPSTATLPQTPTSLTLTLSGQQAVLLDSVQDGKGVAIRIWRADASESFSP